MEPDPASNEAKRVRQLDEQCRHANLAAFFSSEHDLGSPELQSRLATYQMHAEKLLSRIKTRAEITAMENVSHHAAALRYPKFLVCTSRRGNRVEKRTLAMERLREVESSAFPFATLGLSKVYTQDPRRLYGPQYAFDRFVLDAAVGKSWASWRTFPRGTDHHPTDQPMRDCLDLIEGLIITRQEEIEQLEGTSHQAMQHKQFRLALESRVHVGRRRWRELKCMSRAIAFLASLEWYEVSVSAHKGPSGRNDT